MSDLPQAKPREKKTKRGYNIYECPQCHCKLEIVPKSIVDVEVDEFGKLKRDVNGHLIPKTRVSYEYMTLNEVYALSDVEVEIFDPLRERTGKERDEILALTEELKQPKPKKGKLLAELTA